MPIFDDLDPNQDRPSPEPLDPSGPHPSGPRLEEHHESGPAPQNIDSLTTQEQEQGIGSISTTSSISAQQQQQPSLIPPSAPSEVDRAQDTPSAQLDPSRHYRTEAEKARKVVQQQRKPKEREGPPPRLSSTLSVNSE